MSKHKIHVRGYAMILASSVLFGTYGIWSKYMGDDFGVFYQGWVRSAIILVILCALLSLTKGFRKIEKQDLKWVLVTIGFSLFTVAPIYYAFISTSIATATLLFYGMFIITSYVIGRLFLGEKITKIKLVAIALAFVGLLLIFGFSLAKFSLFGVLMAALNGVASGGEVSSTKKSTGKYSSLLITTYAWAGVFITHLVLSIATGEDQWPAASQTEWLTMVLFAIVAMLAFWLVVEGFKFVDASIGSLVGLSEIIWGVLFGIFLFNEQVGITVWIGGALVLAAGMLPDLMNVLEGKKTKTPVEPAREM